MTLKRRLSATVLGLGLASAPGQDLLSKAPPDVDGALREQVTKFVGLEMDGKFRQAEASVCEDSKDIYYDAEKRRWKSQELVRINYEPGFQAAKVVMTLGWEFRTLAGVMPAKLPMTLQWKVVNGQWCRYLPPPPKENIQTPFGVMWQNQAKVGSSQAAQSGTPAAPAMQHVDLNTVMRGPAANRTRLVLKTWETSSDQVELTNSMPGEMRLALESMELPGMKIKLSSPALAAGQKAVIRLDYVPPDASPKPEYSLVVRVEPLGKSLTIPVGFATTPEAYQKAISVK